jgi:predicted MFS family arabinose efflux permease
MGDQFVAIACFTIITISYPEDKETYIGLAEGCIGIGLMIGPALGSFFYEYLQYKGTFYAFSVLMFVCAIAAIFVLPDNLNNSKINVGS